MLRNQLPYYTPHTLTAVSITPARPSRYFTCALTRTSDLPPYIASILRLCSEQVQGEWAAWLPKHLCPTDAVVLEATTNAWTFYDQVAPLVGRAVVPHPGLVKVIASARVKTDNRNALHLARLLAANLIPKVWVPPLEVRELRALLAHRRRLIKIQTMTRNRLNCVIHRYNLTPPRGELFTTPKYPAWWRELNVSPTEKLRIHQDLATLDHLDPEITKVGDELHRLSMVSPWAEQTPFLMQLPRFGIVVAMTVFTASRKFCSGQGRVKYWLSPTPTTFLFETIF